MGQGGSIGDRALELIATMVLGLATVATAWCAFQSSEWNERSGQESRAAAEHRLNASRLFNLGAQEIAYDATISALYAQALVEGQDRLLTFYRDNLVRPEFLPVIQDWEAGAAAGADLTSLAENEEYLTRQFADSTAADAAAEEALVRSREAADIAGNFIRTTIILASALFFAGVTPNFRARFARVLLLFAAMLLLAIGIAFIADYPVA